MANQTNPSSAPGLQGAVQPFGALVIDAPCAPQAARGALAFYLPCGGTLTNPTQSPVYVGTQLVDLYGNPQGSQNTGTLTQGQVLTLQTPPTGQQWLVVDLSQRQVTGIAVKAVVIGGAVLGFATYGVVELVEHIHQRRRQRRIQRLFY